MKGRKAILSVTNDLTSEQRVHKVCLFLLKIGYDVTMVGRLRRKSKPLSSRPYHTKRMFLLFEKGPLFYAEYNLRLFFFLLFRRADVLVANDLDTLLANYLVSRIKGNRLIHDSHEYFTGVPELEGRNFAQNTWKRIERWIFPKLTSIYTVNDSIAGLYRDEYDIKAKVVRNFPLKQAGVALANKTRKEMDLPESQKIILYQGSVNVDRGLLEAVEAMQFVKTDAILLVVGDGDILDQVRSRVDRLGLNKKVIFRKRVPFEELKNYTLHADLGISLDRDTNINYRFSLPNKIFDFIHAGVPVLASSLVEIRKIFQQYSIGELAVSLEAKRLAAQMDAMLNDTVRIKEWKANCIKASSDLCWENEEKVLQEIYNP